MRSTADTDYQRSRQGNFHPQTSFSEEEDEEDVEYQEEDRNRFEDSYGYGDADGVSDEDADMGDYQAESLNAGARSNGQHYEPTSSDLLVTTPPILGGSRSSMLDPRISFSAAPKSPTYQKIAKDYYTKMGVPTIEEPDDLVLNTENIITRLYDEGLRTSDDDYQLQLALKIIPGELTQLWRQYNSQTAALQSEEYAAVIGPGPKSSKFAQANFIASLALQIYHPKVDDTISFQPKVKPLPQVLLEWIDEHHDPYPSQIEELQLHRPSPSNHPAFWDTILNSLLRGKVVAVVNILKNAGWRHAQAEIEDIRRSSSTVGYTGIALSNIERVISKACEVLSQCPAVHGDWNIRNSEWTLFRVRVSQALEDLKTFAEGRNRDRSDSEGFGTSTGRSNSYSQTAKKAESQVPWSIYQNLLALYGLVIGESDPIVANGSDWFEATFGLLVWWDDDKEDRRLTLGRSRRLHGTASKGSDLETYLRKLRRSFELATSESTELTINTNDKVEVALTSLLEGDNESVVGFLRGWSGPISSAVAEVASLAGWLPHAEPQSLINMELDQDDMELLGIVSSPSKADGVKDQTLIAYARTLANHRQIKAPGIPPREGWEISIAVLGRLDSAARSEEMVGDFLRSFPLDSSATVDKLWRLLNNIGMTRHAETTAEVRMILSKRFHHTNQLQSYANFLAEGSHKYGEALWYYSLAHKPHKVKDVLDLLISFSLIQSTTYPPESELDDHLRRLISSPKAALSQISKMDIDAAELLQTMLSGYATLRKFYSLRDEDISSTAGKTPSSTTRNKEAATALLAVITSSDDNIRGGIYDEERGAVVNVDFLLALLGEAMVFVNQTGFNATVSQIDILLKALEDLQAVGPQVFSTCNEFLQTVIASGQGLKGSSPADMLRKSTSNTSGTSSFSLVGSSMLASQLKQSMGSSGVLVKGNIKRGWDWRHGVSAGTTGDDVLRILRLGLAKDLAKAWLIEVENRI